MYTHKIPVATYDYDNQAWIGIDGKYMSCAHPESIHCTCYGKIHAGECSGRHSSVKEIAQCAECALILA